MTSERREDVYAIVFKQTGNRFAPELVPLFDSKREARVFLSCMRSDFGRRYSNLAVRHGRRAYHADTTK